MKFLKFTCILDSDRRDLFEIRATCSDGLFLELQCWCCYGWLPTCFSPLHLLGQLCPLSNDFFSLIYYFVISMLVIEHTGIRPFGNNILIEKNQQEDLEKLLSILFYWDKNNKVRTCKIVYWESNRWWNKVLLK